MSVRTLVRMAVAGLFWLGLGVSLPAQDPQWAEKMFEKLSVDFGVVARGSDCSCRLKIKNIYQETIHITHVSTSCGCSAAKPSANQIPSGQEAYLDIAMDTTRFMRKKDSAVLVTLSEPTKRVSKEIRIPLSVYIRTDVVFSPGAVNFGAVDVGAGSERKISVAYAGRNDWTIRSVKSPRSYIEAAAVETARPNDGTVNYQLTVTLKPDAPVGAIREQLFLITDDQSSPQVPLLVEGRVEADITVATELLALGQIPAGQTKTMNVVVRGRKPFKIDKIECTTPSEAFKVKLPTDEKTVHVLPLTFTAPADATDVNELFTITIPGRNEPVTFRVQGKVVAAKGS